MAADEDFLLKAFNEGDNPAFAEIYKRYYPGLFVTCLRIIRPKGTVEDARDIISMTFLKLYERRQKINSWKGVTHFLYLALRTGCIDFLRKKGRQKETSYDPASLHAVNDELDEAFLERVVQEKQVLEVIKELPARSKEVVELYYLKGLKYQEIGRQLNISPRTVENQLRYALNKLRVVLTDKRVSGVLLMALAGFAGILTDVAYLWIALHISGMLPAF